MNKAKQPSNVVRINALLRKLGREERLVRGRGYYYLRRGDAMGWYSSSIYVYDMNGTDFQDALEQVAQVYANSGSKAAECVAAQLRNIR